jgi:hypothetical protein
MTMHTAAEVAARFGPTASARWISTLARAGKTPGYTLGPRRTVLFTDAQLDAFLKSRTEAPATVEVTGIATVSGQRRRAGRSS